MLGLLAPDEIEQLLEEEVLGRIGCYANGIIYVVPINYVYDGTFVYAYSKVGMKVQMMRQNPMVCFEVDKMEDMTNWRSVVAWGKYEELKNNDQKVALHKLVRRFHTVNTSETSVPEVAAGEQHQSHADPFKNVIYRIRLIEKSGRFERR